MEDGKPKIIPLQYPDIQLCKISLNSNFTFISRFNLNYVTEEVINPNRYNLCPILRLLHNMNKQNSAFLFFTVYVLPEIFH